MDHPAADQIADFVGGEILAGEHAGHPRRAQRRARINAADACMRMRRTHEHGIDLARPVDVGDISPVAGQKPNVFDSFDGVADSRITHLRIPYSAAWLIAPVPMA